MRPRSSRCTARQVGVGQADGQISWQKTDGQRVGRLAGRQAGRQAGYMADFRHRVWLAGSVALLRLEPLLWGQRPRGATSVLMATRRAEQDSRSTQRYPGRMAGTLAELIGPMALLAARGMLADGVDVRRELLPALVSLVTAGPFGEVSNPLRPLGQQDQQCQSAWRQQRRRRVRVASLAAAQLSSLSESLECAGSSSPRRGAAGHQRRPGSAILQLSTDRLGVAADVLMMCLPCFGVLSTTGARLRTDRQLLVLKCKHRSTTLPRQRKVALEMME
jgi:hypothetical protein